MILHCALRHKSASVSPWHTSSPPAPRRPFSKASFCIGGRDFASVADSNTIGRQMASCACKAIDLSMSNVALKTSPLPERFLAIIDRPSALVNHIKSLLSCRNLPRKPVLHTEQSMKRVWSKDHVVSKNKESDKPPRVPDPRAER